MNNILIPTIDESIELDPRFTKGMPDSIKQPLLVTITMAMERYKCDWRDLVWTVKYYSGQPVISVKPKGINDGKNQKSQKEN